MAHFSAQGWRSLTQTAFFILFLAAPPLDLFRYDLTQGHFILLGHAWTLHLDSLQHGQGDAVEAALRVFFLGLLPVIALAAGFLLLAWRWGRLYCGWLCPHFSVVEIINRLMLRATGKPSLWLRRPLPERQPDGRRIRVDARYWLPTLLAVAGFACLWAVVLLTYLLPPFEIYHNLLHASLTRNQALFIGVGTALFSIDFLLARHLFCRFGCAVGLFQSLAWMSNRRAMVVGFERERASACKRCNNACDNVCPMRLQPRSLKRKMFTCTQCGQCIHACSQVQGDAKRSLLHWISGEAATQLSAPPMDVPPVRMSAPHKPSE